MSDDDYDFLNERRSDDDLALYPPPRSPEKETVPVLRIPPLPGPLLVNNYFMAKERRKFYSQKKNYSGAMIKYLCVPITNLDHRMFYAKGKAPRPNTFVQCDVCEDYMELVCEQYEKYKDQISEEFEFYGQFTCPACLGQEEKIDLKLETDTERDDKDFRCPPFNYLSDGSGPDSDYEGYSADESGGESDAQSMDDDEIEALGWRDLPERETGGEASGLGCHPPMAEE
jgi:hypothetical protein